VNPSERQLRARAAAHALHAGVDPTAHTVPARAGFMRRFLNQVDPDGVLPPDERERRAEHLMRSHMLTLARKSAQARRR
jgi:hypothetical protein